jgi:hypothetical protein
MALVVFLRGVNVGGHKTFRPSLLANDLNHLDVVNVGAAGTFVVRNRISQSKLRVELLRRLPFETEVVMSRVPYPSRFSMGGTCDEVMHQNRSLESGSRPRKAHPANPILDHPPIDSRDGLNHPAF